MIIERAPTYRSGGVTSLMSVGKDDMAGFLDNIDPVIKYFGAFVAGYMITKQIKPKWKTYGGIAALIAAKFI